MDGSIVPFVIMPFMKYGSLLNYMKMGRSHLLVPLDLTTFEFAVR